MLSLEPSEIPVARIPKVKKNGKSQFIYLHKEGNGKKSIINTNKKITLVPRIEDDQRDTIYIAGPSGSGKSTVAGKYMEDYQFITDNPIYIFSKVLEDKAFENCDCEYIDLNDIDGIQIDDFQNCMCVFDDIDTISDPLQRKLVIKLRNAILEHGRHQGIDIICTSHLMCDRENTRHILLESNKIILFPGAGSDEQYIRGLKSYCGISDKSARKLLDTIRGKSRWMCICKTFPMYIIHEYGGMMVNDIDKL
jgi:ABC-type dipeptide/oligopeptide/nickel transport system ATPase component